MANRCVRPGRAVPARAPAGPRASGRCRRLARSGVRRQSGESSASDAVDRGSLVEALDDLGPASDYSPDGYRRLAALSAEMRRLRQRLGGPLPELVAEVEHVTGVGVEVAARADRARVGRAHLDRFLDEAAEFAADADEATLGAFLAFLDAAEIEENGLEAGEAVVARRADTGADRARREGAGVGSGRGARAGGDGVSGRASGRRLDPHAPAAPGAAAGRPS